MAYSEQTRVSGLRIAKIKLQPVTGNLLFIFVNADRYWTLEVTQHLCKLVDSQVLLDYLFVQASSAIG